MQATRPHPYRSKGGGRSERVRRTTSPSRRDTLSVGAPHKAHKRVEPRSKVPPLGRQRWRTQGCSKNPWYAVVPGFDSAQRTYYLTPADIIRRLRTCELRHRADNLGNHDVRERRPGRILVDVQRQYEMRIVWCYGYAPMSTLLGSTLR